MDSKWCHTLLGEDSAHEGHKYQCSNPNCRKVFSRPKIIKYQVCPVCQTLVTRAEAENQDGTPTFFASQRSVKLKRQEMVEAEDSEGLTLEVQPASIEPPPAERSMPEKKPDGSEEAILPEQVQTSPQEKVERPPVQQTKTLEAETVSQASSECQYGFGYLGHRKKGEEIPNTCMECPKLLNCMLSDYYKKEESVSEIKKWYVP